MVRALKSPLIGVSALGIISGCVSVDGQKTAHADTFRAASFNSSALVSSRPSPVRLGRTEIAALIRSQYKVWRGTRYRMGGNGRGGFDCSGFSQYVFAQLFNVRLPRTTSGQVVMGRKIKQSQLQPGDLIFFRPRSYPRHVGVYLGNGEFVHASSSKGITLSHMGSEYWRDAYWTSRRVIVPSTDI